MLIAGAVAFVLAALCAVLAAESLVGLLAATGFLGLGVLFSVIGEQAWVMRGATAGRLDFIFGVYTFATSGGQMLGPLLLLLPPDLEASTPPFDLISGTVLAAALVTLFLSTLIPSRRSTYARSTEASSSRSTLSALIRRRGVVSALIASSIALSSLDILLAYLPLLAEERSLPAAWLSVMLVARGAATMLSRICLGTLTRRLGRRRVLVIAGTASAASLIVLAPPSPPILLVVAMVVYGLSVGIVQPLTMSWMTLLTPVRDRGVAASLRLLGNRAGQTVLPVLAAGVSFAGGATPVFAVTAAFLSTTAWLSRWAPNDDDDLNSFEPTTLPPDAMK